MSYYHALTKDERLELQVVSIPIDEYLQKIIDKDNFNNVYFEPIENIAFTQFIHFEGNYNFGIEFKNCYFLQEVSFNEANFTDFKMNNCFFDEQIIIGSKVSFNDSFDLVNISIKKQLYIMGGKYSKCKWSFKNYSTLKIDGGEFSNLDIGYWEDAKFEYISLNLRNIKGHVNINGNRTQVRKLMINNFAVDATLTIEDIWVNKLSIHRYKNEKGLRLINIKGLESEEKTEFSIYGSSLGKAEIYSVDFKSFENFYIVDSQLTDCSFVNVKWKFDIRAFKGSMAHKTEEEKILNDKISLIEENDYKTYNKIQDLKHDKDVKAYYSKARENYRQLKYALSKQGDIINEQKFHSKEMQAYNRTLSLIANLETKLIVKLSYWFSDFGQSITRPFAALLIGHWILLMILIYFGGIENLNLSISHITKDGLETGFTNYLKLINPLRKTDDFSGSALAIDLLMRIWSSYMLYNIIRASRRFIKQITLMKYIQYFLDSSIVYLTLHPTTTTTI
jgi:hypothetical protein